MTGAISIVFGYSIIKAVDTAPSSLDVLYKHNSGGRLQQWIEFLYMQKKSWNKQTIFPESFQAHLHFPAPSEKVAHCLSRMKALNGLCTLRVESERQGSSSVISWHTYTHIFDVFFSELGQILKKSPPPIASGPLQEWARRRRKKNFKKKSGFGADLKTTPYGLSWRHKATISNIYQKASPHHSAARGVFGRKRSLNILLKHQWTAVHRSALPL